MNTSKITPNELSFKFNQYVKEYGVVPCRRSYDKWKEYRGSSSSCRKYFGSWNNFVEKMGYVSNFGIYNKLWFDWEKLILKIIQEMYPNQELYTQYYDPKSNTRVDYYLPDLKIAIDAKTSNYDIDSRNKVLEVYKKIYEKLILFCLHEKSDFRYPGVQYFFGTDLIAKVKSRKLKRDLKSLIRKDEEYSKNYCSLTKDVLISQIQLLANELGRTPTMREFRNDPRTNAGYRCVFRSFTELLIAAKLQPRKFYKNEIDADMALNYFKEAIEKFKKENGKYLGHQEYNDFSYSNDDVISYSFVRRLTKKSYLKQLAEFGIDTGSPFSKRFNSSEERIISEIKTLGEKLGKRPEHREYRKVKEYCSINAVIDLFGSWENAVQAAGYNRYRIETNNMTIKEIWDHLKMIQKDFYKINKRSFKNQAEFDEFTKGKSRYLTRKSIVKKLKIPFNLALEKTAFKKV